MMVVVSSGTAFILSSSTQSTTQLLRHRPPSLPLFPRTLSSIVKASSSSQEGRIYRGPKPSRDFVADWVSGNDGAARNLPIFVGGLSLLAIVLNRSFSGIAPVADASSSQSRADILAIALSVTNLLAGLVWLSIRPKYISPVALQGVECRRIYSGIPDYATAELLWVWECLSDVTCCKSLVIVNGRKCLLQVGIAAKSSSKDDDAMTVDCHQLSQGSLYQNVQSSGKQIYLANLSLYPGRSELPFLPSDTQSVILQPLGSTGLAILGGDTIRGFSSVDQAWITLIFEKLDATISKVESAFTSAS
ncbi:hypothetical protein QJS04_geneDACA006866 [Acorus gramineus]|uniref:Protein COFACTOR ASSEMBLY OF COMPLEX C SUBUNIT B CCB4, chloroplastic n=1 Tax=Acorus gramineus TaxID=55184 RepID=A0AAV9AZ51_ACOGR|nr:hypothetical protein QJS04_geneDACA006866 [Acorus gramineus]